jgi:hypothetical protein
MGRPQAEVDAAESPGFNDHGAAHSNTDCNNSNNNNNNHCYEPVTVVAQEVSPAGGTAAAAAARGDEDDGDDDDEEAEEEGGGPVAGGGGQKTPTGASVIDVETAKSIMRRLAPLDGDPQDQEHDVTLAELEQLRVALQSLPSLQAQQVFAAGDLKKKKKKVAAARRHWRKPDE